MRYPLIRYTSNNPQKGSGGKVEDLVLYLSSLSKRGDQAMFPVPFRECDLRLQIFVSLARWWSRVNAAGDGQPSA